MKRKSTPQSGLFNPRVLFILSLCCVGVLLAMFSLSASPLSGQNQPSAPATGSAPQLATPTARQALSKLESASRAQMTTQLSRQTGNFSFVKAPNGNVLAADKRSAPPQTRALAFLATHGALVGLNDVERAALSTGSAPATGSNLQVAHTETDSLGSTHVKLDQSYRGLKVLGAQLVVHMNGRGITAVNGNYVPQISLSNVPAVTQAGAGENAVTILRKQGGGADLAVEKTELGIYPLGLLEGTSPVTSRLAYAVEVAGAKLYEQVWIDAQTGALLNRIPLRRTALNRIIYTPQYGTPFDVRHEGDALTPGPTPGTTGAEPINNLYVFAGHTYNMFKSAFGRDSYDGLGHIMHSVLLANDQCPNAYWNGIATNYCPDFDADDVVSHEWGHAYTQYTHNLIYSYQSGALNESYSDIFGETADLLNGVDAEGGGNNAQPMPNGQRWQVGEDVNVFNQPALGILRNMWDPTTFGQPDKTTSPNYSCGSGDGGGVHANSGVPNHAYAMLVDGQTFNGQTVTGIGINRALAIYYRAMTVYQTPSTDFAGHSQALQASCSDLIGQPINVVSATSASSVVAPEVVTGTTCQQVAKAMQAVEMNLPAPCPIIILLDPNAPPACNGATDIFAEDWETGDNGWTRTSTGVTADWNDSTRNLRDFLIDSTLPAGRSGSAAQARNIPIGEPGGGTCAPGGDYSGQFTIENTTAITIPSGASDLKMRFDHYVATETGFDGGQVEISVNGGAFALVPDANYLFNAPNSTFTSVVDGNTNPNAGEASWNGTNIGTPAGQPPGSWGTTIIDLSSLTNPGDTIKIRFTYSQDGCNGVDGWYVDNIRVYACPVLQAPVLSLGPDYENPDTNGSYTLNWTRPLGASGPDVLQVSQSSCVPLLSDNAENGTAQWTIASSDTVAPMWQSAPPNTKPGHNSTTFWANPVSEQETQSQNSTLTFNSPIVIPSSGITTLSFLEWYFNEDDDMGLVEVSTNNGATWAPIYTNARPMGDLPDAGADAFANESLTRTDLNLTIYSGQTIRLRFRYQLGASNFFAFFQYGWHIDDISITNDNWTDVVSTNATSYTVTGLANGSRCYRVRTTYPGPISSPYSAIVSATVNQVTVCPPPPFIDDLEPNQDAGWGFEVAQNNLPSPTWALATDPNAHSATHSFTSDATAPDIKDDRLIAPPQDLSATSHLIFWHAFNTEETYDGGVLEVSTDNGGTWVDLGTSIISGGYNNTIDSGFASPIAGRLAWSGISASYPAMDRVEVNLGAFAGNGVLVRWRLALDNGVLVPGVEWRMDDVQFTNLACDIPPPVPTLVVSRKAHGTAGTFDIPLPLTGGPGIECRNGGVTQVVLTFAQPVTFTGATVSSGAGTVTGTSGSGTTQAVINLTGVTNLQTITVKLLGASAGGLAADIPVPIGVLNSDTTGDRFVNSGDIAQTKSRSGQAVSNTNFRSDVTVDGNLNSGDIALVKSKSGTALP